MRVEGTIERKEGETEEQEQKGRREEGDNDGDGGGSCVKQLERVASVLSLPSSLSLPPFLDYVIVEVPGVVTIR